MAMVDRLDSVTRTLSRRTLYTGCALLTAVACVSSVWLSFAYAADLSTYLTVSICGNGIVDPGEVCDDGYVNNTIAGVYGSTTAQRHCFVGCGGYGPYCGDGVLQVRFTEQCDDGNAIAGDLCDLQCRPEAPVPPRSTGAPPVGSVPPIGVRNRGGRVPHAGMTVTRLLPHLLHFIRPANFGAEPETDIERMIRPVE